MLVAAANQRSITWQFTLKKISAISALSARKNRPPGQAISVLSVISVREKKNRPARLSTFNIQNCNAVCVTKEKPTGPSLTFNLYKNPSGWMSISVLVQFYSLFFQIVILNFWCKITNNFLNSDNFLQNIMFIAPRTPAPRIP